MKVFKIIVLVLILSLPFMLIGCSESIESLNEKSKPGTSYENIEQLHEALKNSGLEVSDLTNVKKTNSGPGTPGANPQMTNPQEQQVLDEIESAAAEYSVSENTGNFSVSVGGKGGFVSIYMLSGSDEIVSKSIDFYAQSFKENAETLGGDSYILVGPNWVITSSDLDPVKEIQNSIGGKIKK